MSEQQPLPRPDPLPRPTPLTRPDRRRVAPATLVVGVVAVGLAVLACAMIVAGLPQQTPSQRLMLELSSLPLSAAVALVVVRVVVERGMLRRRPAGAPLPRLFLAGGVLVGVGLVLWLVVLTGIRLPVVNPIGAQTVLWLGLGSWCLWVLADGQRRDRSDPTDPHDTDPHDTDPHDTDDPADGGWLRWRREPEDETAERD